MIATIAVLFILSYTTFLSDNTEAWVGWTVLGVSILLGILGGYLLYKCQRLGAAALGGWGGLGEVLGMTVVSEIGG